MVIIDVKPLQPHKGTTLASSLHPLMGAIGRPEWTMARLQGVLGHAFQFAMEEGGAMVYHDNLDWSLALDLLPELASFRAYEANKEKVAADLPALKAEARDAAVSSLERGIPALAWQPMSLEQKGSDHPAHHAYCWGLIVGYDPEAETYTIRHPFVSVDYVVRYDALGPADPGGWFNVTVFEAPTEADEKATHRMALRNAVAFAEATRFEQAGRPQSGTAPGFRRLRDLERRLRVRGHGQPSHAPSRQDPDMAAGARRRLHARADRPAAGSGGTAPSGGRRLRP